MQALTQLRLLFGGSLLLRVDGVEHELTRGDILCLTLPLKNVRVIPKRLPLEYAWVQLTGDAANDLCRHVCGSYGIVHHVGPTGLTAKQLKRVVQQVVEDPKRDAFHWSGQAHAFLQAWWREAAVSARAWREAAGAVKAAAGKPALPLPDRRAAPVLIPKHSRVLDKPPRTVQEMADRLGYSRSHLSDTVSRTWKESPGAVLRRDRLQRAAEMLRQGESVKAAARACGYATHQAFSRAFRKHFGHLPSDERRRR
ncbi:MAG: helix-turn-helix transcriptional regulator [Planctomycetota bacterium]